VTLGGGSSYRSVFLRLDNEGGGQLLYVLMAEGRGPGSFGGQRMLSLAITAEASGDGSGYMLGGCCEAAVAMRGSAELEDQAGLSGYDTHPPGWEAGGVCSDQKYDKPGLMMKDTTRLIMQDDAWIDGEPALSHNPDLDDSTWEQFGDLSWDSLSGMYDKIFHDGTFSPNPSTKVVAGETVCDTDDPDNLGSPDPNHPCFDYFPVVLISDNVTFDNGYAQGVFVLAWDEAADQGSEFDLEMNLTVNGVILGKGCVEPEEDSRFYGSILVDGNYRNLHLCNADKDYAMNDGDATVTWSQCAVDRAILNSGLSEFATVTIPGESSGGRLLVSRSFSEGF
jgi:hypothetical protein